jgi:hypothetical protein
MIFIRIKLAKARVGVKIGPQVRQVYVEVALIKPRFHFILLPRLAL